jgi:dTDP-4-dehydrorhamnose 3,5-epimerase-like enzyme
MSNQKQKFDEKDLLSELNGKITFAEVPDKWINIQGTYKRVYTKPKIEGVSIIELPDFRTQTNIFTEMARVDKNNKLMSAPEIEVAQWSYSTFPPNAPKAWHLHGLRDGQWDCWAIVPYPGMTMRVGLWDVRKKSPTSGVRVALDFVNETKLVLIPPGVAHGVVSFGMPGVLFYLTTKHFDKKHPDEGRIPWDIQGKEFWEMKLQ